MTDGKVGTENLLFKPLINELQILLSLNVICRNNVEIEWIQSTKCLLFPSMTTEIFSLAADMLNEQDVTFFVSIFLNVILNSIITVCVNKKTQEELGSDMIHVPYICSISNSATVVLRKLTDWILHVYLGM